MKKVIFILIFGVIVLFIFSCDNLGTAPKINSVVILDAPGNITDTASIGDTLYIYISAEDEDMDIELINTKSYLDDVLMYDTDYITPSVDVVRPLYYIIVKIIGPVGSWRVDVTIFDFKGNESNTFSIYFTVV